MFKFETLDIWKEAIKFAAEIYKLSKKLPDTERFILSAQLTRSAVSISLNIAEGSSRKSKIDFKRFIQISSGSLNEVVTCLFIARNENYINQQEFDQIYQKSEQISKMLYRFSQYLG